MLELKAARLILGSLKTVPLSSERRLQNWTDVRILLCRSGNPSQGYLYLKVVEECSASSTWGGCNTMNTPPIRWPFSHTKDYGGIPIMSTYIIMLNSFILKSIQMSAVGTWLVVLNERCFIWQSCGGCIRQKQLGTSGVVDVLRALVRPGMGLVGSKW